MTEDEKVQIIKSSDLFSSLAVESINELIKLTTEKKIPEGTVFIEQDTLDTVVYFICSGKVKIYRTQNGNQDVLFSVQGKGTLLGEMALLNNFKRAASVIALEELVVLTLTAVDFLKLLYLFPEISINLLKYYAKRIYELGMSAEEMVIKSLLDRTYFALQKLAEVQGHTEVSITMDDLSLIVGSPRSYVVECLKDLEELGKIKLKQSIISIL
jgi:CRP/FNR family transcriptional regulator, cyclic AMP receptor protein